MRPLVNFGGMCGVLFGKLLGQLFAPLRCATPRLLKARSLRQHGLQHRLHLQQTRVLGVRVIGGVVDAKKVERPELGQQTLQVRLLNGGPRGHIAVPVSCPLYTSDAADE